MFKIVRLFLLITIYIVVSQIFINNLDKLLFFLLLVSVFLAFYKNIRSKFSYIMAFLLVMESAFSYFIDPANLRLVYYIYRPAVWVYYFLVIGVLSDFLQDLKKQDDNNPPPLIGGKQGS